VAKPTFVIAGAGVAAGTAADTLRSSGFDGRLIVVGKEADPPYNRPTLSKERLRQEMDDGQVLFHPAEYYRTKDIELLLEREIRHVDVTAREIQFSRGDNLIYDKVLVATGAQVRRASTPGSDLRGVYYLRSLQDCRNLSQALQQRPRVLVLGTGFIGCEVAASAKTLGCEVTLVGRSAPLAHALGSQIGEVYTQYHRGNGIDIRIGASIEQFDGSGRLERAALSDGSIVECDVAVIGIGVEPSLEILGGEPVETDDGILVDEYCRTNVPGVFAIGDVASSWNPRYAKRIRVEHFDNAQHQAVVAAKAMLGPAEPYNPIPSFWSDQFSYKMQYRGHASHWDAVVFRGKTEEASFSAFYIKDEALQAVCSVNRYGENYAARRLIGKRVKPRLLQDDQVNIKEIEA
jgi:3-phenylpropionate/trans-cinnamate dioxygenase ferredoxin reductase component